MILNGLNGVPLNMTNQHNFYVAPVAGFAWDVFGDGRTSLRGGFGVTYNRNGGMGAACSQGCVNFPTVQSVSLISTSFPNPLGGTPAPLTANSITAMTLDYKLAQTKNFSLSLQHQFGRNWFVSVAGAGDVARNLQASMNINQPGSFGAYDFNPNLNTSAYTSAYYAPYQGLSAITLSEPIGRDNWAALEFGMKHPIGNNLYMTVAYTWSHNLDNSGGFQNVYNGAQAYGNSTLNTPHVFTTSLIYSLPPFAKSTGWRRTVLGGWKLSDMTTVHSGSSINMGLSTANNGLATRPDVMGGPVTYPKMILQWFNTAPFFKAPNGYFGDVGNGTLYGPHLVNFNMAMYKDFRIREHLTFQFRGEFFNVFNHTNFNSPNASLGAGTFGQLTSAKDPRTGELALKFKF
jgi:hypothetical protein